MLTDDFNDSELPGSSIGRLFLLSVAFEKNHRKNNGFSTKTAQTHEILGALVGKAMRSSCRLLVHPIVFDKVSLWVFEAFVVFSATCQLNHWIFIAFQLPVDFKENLKAM